MVVSERAILLTCAFLSALVIIQICVVMNVVLRTGEGSWVCGRYCVIATAQVGNMQLYYQERTAYGKLGSCESLVYR